MFKLKWLRDGFKVLDYFWMIMDFDGTVLRGLIFNPFDKGPSLKYVTKL